ncbi:MAG: NUDIX hydrolase [Candidatus Wildermuthbacteria bacterium]|nr:NUDIX hydrolase [Candidatus Wildermuthbacteria bacterium]
MDSFRKIALIFLENEEGKLLFLLRDNNPHIPFPNTWDLIGGHLEGSETPEEALRREVREEIGEELLDYSFSFFRSYEVLQGDAYPNIKFVYCAKFSKPIPELKLGNEGQRLELFSYEDLKNISLANVMDKIVEDYMKARKAGLISFL